MNELDYDPNDIGSLMKYLRLNNIFAPQNMSQVSQQPNQMMPPAGSPDDSSMIDPNEIMQKLMNPNEDMFNRMKSEVDSMPLKSNFKKPGLGKKILAGLAGMGAPNALAASQIGERIKYGPYLEAKANWEDRLKPTEKLAEFENTRNTNARMTGSTMLRDIETGRRQTETERKNAAVEEQRNREIKIKEDRAEAYIKAKDFAEKHPKHIAVTDKTGKVWFVDPTDPEKPPIDSGLEKPTDLEKMDLRVQGRLEEIQAQAEANKSLERLRQTNRTDLEGTKETNRETLEGTKQENRLTTEGVRQGNRIDLKKIPSGNSIAARPQSETQRKQGIINKANKIISERPDLKSYIVFEKNNSNNVIGVHIASGKYNPFSDEKKRMEAYNLVFGEEPVPGVKQDKNVTPQSAGAKPTTRADGKTKVKRKSDGLVGWVTNPDMSKYTLEP